MNPSSATACWDISTITPKLCLSMVWRETIQSRSLMQSVHASKLLLSELTSSYLLFLTVFRNTCFLYVPGAHVMAIFSSS